MIQCPNGSFVLEHSSGQWHNLPSLTYQLEGIISVLGKRIYLMIAFVCSTLFMIWPRTSVKYYSPKGLIIIASDKFYFVLGLLAAAVQRWPSLLGTGIATCELVPSLSPLASDVSSFSVELCPPITLWSWPRVPDFTFLTPTGVAVARVVSTGAGVPLRQGYWIRNTRSTPELPEEKPWCLFLIAGSFLTVLSENAL